MAQLLVTVEDRQLLNGIREQIARGTDPRAALEAIADDFLAMEAEQFASQGARGATPWRPLSPEWAARKGGRSILIGSSGRLARSLTRSRARGSRRQITVRGGRTSSVEMGSSHPLAHLHQAGTAERYVRTYRGKPLTKPRYAGRLPARPVVTVTPRDEQRWHGILVEHLFGQTRTLGL